MLSVKFSRLTRLSISYPFPPMSHLAKVCSRIGGSRGWAQQKCIPVFHNVMVIQWGLWGLCRKWQVSHTVAKSVVEKVTPRLKRGTGESKVPAWTKMLAGSGGAGVTKTRRYPLNFSTGSRNLSASHSHKWCRHICDCGKLIGVLQTWHMTHRFVLSSYYFCAMARQLWRYWHSLYPQEFHFLHMKKTSAS